MELQQAIEGRRSVMRRHELSLLLIAMLFSFLLGVIVNIDHNLSLSICSIWDCLYPTIFVGLVFSIFGSFPIYLLLTLIVAKPS